jgi:integrase/recombinase XerD
MIEELQRRNFAETTIRSYVHGVEHFSRFFHRRPDQLGPEHIRQYQAMLFHQVEVQSEHRDTTPWRSAVLLYQGVEEELERCRDALSEEGHPLPKILSPEEVACLIDAAELPFYRILLMTLYGTGARRTEAAHLKVGDIDSRRMVVHIHGGKGNRDRDVMLSQKLLDALRGYWRGLRRKPTEWLFPGNRWHTGSRPIMTKVLWMLVSTQPNAPDLHIAISTLTRFDIVSRPICWKRAQTCARSSCCSVTVTSKRRPSICICPAGISVRQPVLWTH